MEESAWRPLGSVGGTFMDQKRAIRSPFPVFEVLSEAEERKQEEMKEIEKGRGQDSSERMGMEIEELEKE